MKGNEIAILGVRLIALASIAFGCVVGVSTAVMHCFFQFQPGELGASELHLHDTYFVITNVSYDLLVPSSAGILTGAMLWLASRHIARLLIRGLNESQDRKPDHPTGQPGTQPSAESAGPA